MDTTILFEKYTIDEIREIEKKTRQDIERKKEDLRQMVGERYRELIEAADTIKEMKNSADNVNQSVAKMQEMCNNLKQSFHTTARGLSLRVRKDTHRRKDESQFYAIAVQIKLLLDMPEKIWSALESSAYLRASQLFLLARHINTGLQRDSQQAAKIATYFPVLARQWAAIGHFKTTILQTCRDRLKDVGVSDQVTAECLCSMLLLEESTPVQVFNEFLTARTTAVRQLFEVDQSAVSIKSQVSDVVHMIANTIHQIYTIFYKDLDTSGVDVANNLLASLLSQVADKSKDGIIIKSDGPPSISSKYLPKRVTEFRPSVKAPQMVVPVDQLRESCQQWVHRSITDVHSGLGKLLSFITTVKGLAAIRDQVWSLLAQDETMKTWDVVCDKVLQRKLNLWEEFLCKLFVERAKALLQGHLDSAYQSTTNQVGKVLADLASMDVERDLSSYVWTESAGDIPSNMAWVPVSAKTLAEGGALMMKARAYTPALQSLCRVLDSKLRVVLEDSYHYTHPSVEETTPPPAPYVLTPMPASPKSKSPTEPFDKYADKELLQDFIRSSCQQCIHKLLDHLKQMLEAGRQQVKSSPDSHGNRIVIDRILLLGRLTHALCELSPHLIQCMSSTCSDKTDTPARPVKRSALGKRQSLANSDDPKWMELRSQLNAFSKEAFSMWSEHTSQCLVSQFTSILSDNSGQALLLASTRWEELDIEEETEEGERVRSTIRVPLQASWYVQSLLYNLCEEVNRIGGHSLGRSSLQSLIEHLSQGLVQAYSNILQTTPSNSAPDMEGDESSSVPLTQNRALQLLFDFKFLTNILPRKEESEEYQKECQKVVEGLESRIDPFDLDVFAPYIQTHLTQQTQRCNVLYGALTSLDRHGSFLAPSPRPAGSGGHQEQHNVLPLTPAQGRLPLLPLSTQSQGSRSMGGLPQPPIVQPPKPKTSALLGGASGTGAVPGSPPPVLPSPQNQSFLGQMSTIWFSNVTNRAK